jgi:hypothetical protein
VSEMEMGGMRWRCGEGYGDGDGRGDEYGDGDGDREEDGDGE